MDNLGVIERNVWLGIRATIFAYLQISKKESYFKVICVAVKKGWSYFGQAKMVLNCDS